MHIEEKFPDPDYFNRINFIKMKKSEHFEAYTSFY